MSYSDRLDTITEKYQTSFGKLDASELNWKASANKWSIAQNIDHIITINESYYPIFDSVHNGTLKLAFISKFGFMVNWFGDIILKSVNPDRNKKTKTFDIWQPSQSDLPGNILEIFKKHQELMKDKITTLDPEIQASTIISSPANKHIVYKLDKAIEVIIAHEERHFKQAMEVYKIINESKST